MVGADGGPIHFGDRPSSGEIEVGVLHGDCAIDLHSAEQPGKHSAPREGTQRIVVSGILYQRTAAGLQRMQRVLSIPQRWVSQLLLESAPPLR